jgi:hypothetical protein
MLGTCKFGKKPLPLHVDQLKLQQNGGNNETPGKWK